MCITFAELVVGIHNNTLRNGGVTVRQSTEKGHDCFELLTGKVDEPLFVVSTGAPSLHIALGEFNMLSTMALVRHGLYSDEMVMAIADDPYLGFGTWLDHETQTVHVDAVRLYTDEVVARAIATDLDQIAYYDLAKGEEVRL